MASESPSRRVWYLDTSVAIRILLGHSADAAKWFDQRADLGDDFVSSRLLELEMARVYRRESLDLGEVADFIAELTLLRLDDALVEEAAAIRPHVRSLDALHLASALRVGVEAITVVSHDSTMLRVAAELGFAVHDPVGGDS